MAEQIGNQACQCHECTQARYRGSFQHQINSLVKGSVAVDDGPKNLNRKRSKRRLKEIWSEQFPNKTIEDSFVTDEPWKWFDIYANLRGKDQDVETTVKIFVEAIERRNKQNHALSETIHKQRLEIVKRLKEIENLKLASPSSTEAK